MIGCGGFHDLREEILERTWNLSEEGGATLQGLVSDLAEIASRGEVTGGIEGLVSQGLVLVRDGSLGLTAEGEGIARHVVRAHRLAARLLADLLELSPSLIEGDACRLEHAISPELAEKLCTLLGHPPTSPDGRRIPRGACCDAMVTESGPAVFPLSSLSIGGVGRIVFIHPHRAALLDQLGSLGLVPGTDVRLKQSRPALVVQIGETTLAMDDEVARGIYVKPARERHPALA